MKLKSGLYFSLLFLFYISYLYNHPNINIEETIGGKHIYWSFGLLFLRILSRNPFIIIRKLRFDE